MIRAGDGDTITLFCGLKKIPINSFISFLTEGKPLALMLNNRLEGEAAAALS